MCARIGGGEGREQDPDAELARRLMEEDEVMGMSSRAGTYPEYQHLSHAHSRNCHPRAHG
jgi:hypothetical protein